MPTEGKANLNKDHSFTNFPITISNNVKSSVSNWSVEGNGVQASTKTYSLTEQPPINFNADGNPITSWSMTGNGEQSGTPTPDNIIMPTFCGVRTGNLFDKTQSKTITNKYLLSNGEESSSASGWAASAYIPVNGEYVTLSGVGGNAPSICAYDSNMQFVRGANYDGKNVTTLSISGCSYVRFSYVPAVHNDIAMLNLGSTALPYEPYGWAEKITCAGQTTPVYLGQTQTMRRVRKRVLTGQETFYNKSSTYQGSFYVSWASLGGKSNQAFLCDRAENVSSISNYAYGKCYSDSTMNLWIGEASWSLQDFKSYLAAQYANGTPVTVWYILATPETAIVNEPLCKIGDYVDELSSEYASINIPTQNGSNTLTVDTTLQPTSMTITTASSVYPKNPIDPEFVGVRTGNLFDKNATNTNNGYVDGSFLVSTGATTSSTAYFVSEYIPVSASESYTLLYSEGKLNSPSFCLYNANKEYVSGYRYGNQNPVSFTVPDGVSFMRFSAAKSTKDIIMLNLGSTALSYEPYGWKISITNNEQTLPAYLGEVQTVRKIKKWTLTGNEAIFLASTDANRTVCTVIDNSNSIQDVVGVCSHIEWKKGSDYKATDYNRIVRYGVKGIYLSLSNDLLSEAGNVGTFKTYLQQQYSAGHPVTLWYVLATPTTGIVNEPLCKIGSYSDELLSTSQGTPQLTLSTEESNLISFETNLQPSKFNIKYYEEDYTKIKDIQMQIPTAKTYNYTEYPITISNAVNSNCSIDLFGNSLQNGTPSPDNPIIPEFCGNRTGNLFDISSVKTGKFVRAGNLSESRPLGEEVLNVEYDCSDYIAVSAGMQYTVKYPAFYNAAAAGLIYFDADKNAISGVSLHEQGGETYSFTTPVNCAYIRLSWYNINGDTCMLNLGTTALPYEPYGWAEKITCAGQTVPVYLGQVQTVRRVRKLVLTGEETIPNNDGASYNSETSTDRFVRDIPLSVGNNGTSEIILCTHLGFQAQSWAARKKTGCCIYCSGNTMQLHLRFNNTTLGITQSDTNEQRTEKLKAYIAAQYAAGTPVTAWYVLATPTTGIVNEPLAKIGDYSDELQTTIQLEPFKQNLISIDTQLQPSKVSLTYKTKESTDPYKLIKYALDNNNNYVYKSPYFYTWEGIREIVRAGKASQYYPIGSIIYDNFDSSTGTAFQVVAYDNHFDPTLTAQGYTHSMTLCELLLTDVITFDAQEAFIYTEADIPAGTYKFTIPNYDSTYGGNKTYYFTSTATLPSGSQVVMNWPYQQTPKTVTGYAGPNPQTNTTALSGFSALTLTEWVDGTSPEATDLGTIAGPTTQLGTSNYGQMNHIHRARYGSNNYLQSGIRQYINSNSAANAWWTPQTVFDRPYGSGTSAGRLTKLNQDLVSVMATPEIKSRTNSYFETTSLDGTTFTLSTDYTINTDKMFLLSPMEVNFNTTDTTIGTTLNYYVGADNDKRIKLRKSNNTAYYWWLRTPYQSTASSVRLVLTSGALYYGASSSHGAAPACVIQ